jgi:hypothetical protein
MEQTSDIEFGDQMPIVMSPDDMTMSGVSLADVPEPDILHSWMRDMGRKHEELQPVLDEYNFRKATQIFGDRAFGDENRQSQGVYRRLLRIFEHLRALKLDLTFEINQAAPLEVDANGRTITIVSARENSLTITNENGERQIQGWNNSVIQPAQMTKLFNNLRNGQDDALIDARIYLFAVIYRVSNYDDLAATFEQSYGTPVTEWLQSEQWRYRQETKNNEESNEME